MTMMLLPIIPKYYAAISLVSVLTRILNSVIFKYYIVGFFYCHGKLINTQWPSSIFYFAEYEQNIHVKHLENAAIGERMKIVTGEKKRVK